MACITGKNVGFQYRKNYPILDDINFDIEPGKMYAILGKNGCGKSTLIKIITALLPLSEGNIFFNGFNIKTREGINEIRKHCGIIFQNPDNQFVSPIIEDDISFGLTNHQIPEKEQTERIHKALNSVGLPGFEKKRIDELSGGQKQRAAIAGILAINNDILIFDEATSMLDPVGRDEMTLYIENLRYEKKTIIIISQYVDDVIKADKIFLMSDHHIIAAGTPREILTNVEILLRARVQIPFPVRVYHDLVKKGIMLNNCPITIEELSEEICSLS